MKVLVFTLMCTVAASVAVYTAQNSSQSQSTTTQNQRAGQTHPVMLTGCVYQASDQPEVFALERTPRASGTATGTSGTSAQSTTNNGSSSSSGTSSSANTTARRSGWFRLTSSAAQQLSQYVGKAVRVNGTVRTPQEETGGEVIVHDVRPNQVTVTAIDLRPAPELKIQSITPAQGDCSTQTSTR